jgi:hypothetical protein
LLALALCLFAFTAVAQPGPIFVMEHDWRILIGDKYYGVLQSSLRGDPTPWTGVYCGKHLFTVKMTIAQLLALTALPVAVVTGVLLVRRNSRKPAIAS